MSSPKLISSFLAAAIIAIPVFALGTSTAFADSSPVQVPPGGPTGSPSPTTPTPAPTPAPAPTPSPTPGNPTPAPTTPPIHS